MKLKLKMRFEKHDMIVFLVFLGVLFFLVCVAISNFVTIGDGQGFSFNPIPALTNGHLGSTLIVYILVTAALIASSKDYFFEFDSGFGFATTKKSDGYNKWADAAELKKELKMVTPSQPKADAAGIVLINDGKKMWVDDSEYHNLIIGSTGSGKTQCVIYPMVQSLAKHNESMIITDPKGEIYEKTGAMLKKRGYQILVLNFRSPAQGSAWNPLTLPYRLWKDGNYDKSIELLDDLALNILYDDSNKNADPFWEKTSADYFSGLALGLFEDATEEQININSISLMSTIGEEKFNGSTYIKEYFNSKDPTSAAYIDASGTILAPSDTKGSILSVFKQKIKLFASRQNLSEMLSHSDFDLREIGLKKTALFIVIQDEKKTYHSLATILLKQIYETLIDVAYHHGGKLPYRTNFMLDEFANMPPLKDVTTMITAARSRAIRFTFIIQNFAQLNSVYGEQDAETIKGNCGNMVYLISTELKALEEISKMCGEKKAKKDDKVASTPLVSITDLQKLKQFEVIIRRLRLAPFKTKLTPDYQMDWGGKYPKLDLAATPMREKHEVQVFDVREFVKAKKQEKTNNLLGMGGDPTGGALPGLPMFGGMGGGLFGGMPSGMPGALPTGMPQQSPLFSPKETPMMNNDIIPDFNIDDIVKKIDAKIAEIEAEEEKERQAQAQMETPNNLSVVRDEMPISIPKADDIKDAIIDDDPLGNIINDINKREENNQRINDLINQIDESDGSTESNPDEINYDDFI